MANITLKKSTIINIKSNLLSHAGELIDALSSITNSLNSAKEVYNTTGGAQAGIDEIVATIDKLSKGYDSKNKEFIKVMDESVMEYEAKEARANMEISSLDGKTVATMTVGASGLAGMGFNFGKIASNKEDALNGKFIDESKVHSQYFGPGKYTFNYNDDGSVMISKDGQPMAWAQADNGKAVTGDVFAVSGAHGDGAGSSASAASVSAVNEPPKESVVTIEKAGVDTAVPLTGNNTSAASDPALNLGGPLSSTGNHTILETHEYTKNGVTSKVTVYDDGTYVAHPANTERPNVMNTILDGNRGKNADLNSTEVLGLISNESKQTIIANQSKYSSNIEKMIDQAPVHNPYKDYYNNK